MDATRTWQTLKQVMMAALGGLIVLFAVVNSEAVSVNLLFREVELSLSLLILITALAGVVFGWMAGALRGRRKRKALEAEHRAQLGGHDADEEWLAGEERSPEEVPQSRH